MAMLDPETMKDVPAEAIQSYFNVLLQMVQQSMATLQGSGDAPEMLWDPNLYGQGLGGFRPTGNLVPTLAKLNQQFQQNQASLTSIAQLASQSGKTPVVRLSEEGFIELGVDGAGNLVFDEGLQGFANRFAAAQATGFIPVDLLQPQSSKLSATVSRYIRPASTVQPTKPTVLPAVATTARPPTVPTPQPTAPPAVPTPSAPSTRASTPAPVGSIGGSPMTPGGLPTWNYNDVSTPVVTAAQLAAAASGTTTPTVSIPSHTGGVTQTGAGQPTPEELGQLAYERLAPGADWNALSEEQRNYLRDRGAKLWNSGQFGNQGSNVSMATIGAAPSGGGGGGASGGGGGGGGGGGPANPTPADQLPVNPIYTPAPTSEQIAAQVPADAKKYTWEDVYQQQQTPEWKAAVAQQDMELGYNQPPAEEAYNEWVAEEVTYFDENVGKNIRKKVWQNNRGERWDTFEDA